MVGRLRRIELNGAIEIVQGLLNMPLLEMLSASAIVFIGRAVLRQQQCCSDGPGGDGAKAGQSH
jgi:hypothetical protein